MTQHEVGVLAGRGKTGRALARALRERGARVRPLGRADLDRLDPALSGCTAVYLMAPNLHPDEPALVADVLAAAQRVGVDRVVHHSVAAPYTPSMPHHLGKARGEDLVRRSGLRWTVLQPCAYVQNLLSGLRGDEPAVRVPYDPDRLFGLVDLADVAEAAARVLLEDGHEGATYELGGPRPVSARDVAETAARVLRRDVPLQRVPTDEAVAAAPEAEREWLRAMFEYYDRHGLPTGGLVLRALLGRGGTPLAATLARELGAGDPAAGPSATGR
ncbi:NAD(P)H azoreductase [Nocardioides dokdonensis FR1436]|uniref:NAD(P)H azoreductase n=1 Tax=Nocardioides dokdonensis FR1436 TaxID=1300347 RepID=A0A1A9GHH9_9ACTN|nr:NAD(P)H-binding protein [Nocardioides dokdonensis]ANH37757.1 NAD(P)H azoreductase [Nocardioides dokdonensis FR1436]